MTVAISTLLPEARIELPGIPEPVLAAATFRAVRQFFWESEVWKYTYDNALTWAFDTEEIPTPTPGTDTPLKTVVKRVDTVKFSSTGADHKTKVPFKTRDDLDTIDPDWVTASASAPKYWTHNNGGVAVLTPKNNAANIAAALQIRSVIAPVLDNLADTIPANLYYEFEDIIRAKILADLMKQPGKDWTNPRMAAFYSTQYKAGVIKAASRAQADFGQPARTVCYGGI